MEEEMVQADNMIEQLAFLCLELAVVFVVYYICYLFYKHRKKFPLLDKFFSLPIVVAILTDIQYILTNYLKLKLKRKMKEKCISKDKTDLDEVIPPQLLKKYGESIRSLSKESLQKLKEKEGIE